MLFLLCLIRHNIEILHPSHPSPSWLIVIDVRLADKHEDIILHGSNVQGKGAQVITNKGQVIIPMWSQVQETTY